MNANNIISEPMTLEDKLKAIDEAIAKAQEASDTRRRAAGLPVAPVDPAELTKCDGCE